MASVQLECIVVAQPRANVHWFHHGVPVNQNSRISFRSHAILANQSVNDYFAESKHVLHIQSVRDTDFGSYTCRAENVIGMKDAAVELTGRPTVPQFKRSPTASTHNAHNLIWQTESLSAIFEHKLKFRQVPSGNITPNNRRSVGGWVEIIVPSDESEGTALSRLCTHFKMFEGFMHSLVLVCFRSHPYNGLHAERPDAGQRVRSGGSVTQSIRLERYQQNYPLRNKWRK